MAVLVASVLLVPVAVLIAPVLLIASAVRGSSPLPGSSAPTETR
ncbi:hypothetical protein OG271_12345 [Micromonospora rifamycinica]|nr:hypothetical protein [Micromonospora rifamycinica]